MKTKETEVKVSGAEVYWDEEGRDKSRVRSESLPIGETIAMIPLGLIGLLISTFPLSLPVLYLIVLWIID